MARHSVGNYDSKPSWRERIRRSLKGPSPNDALCAAVMAGQFGTVDQMLSSGGVKLEDPVWFEREVDGTRHRLWRTPLEYAIDHGASAVIVQLLLHHGAKKTHGAAHLAVEGLEAPVAPFERENAQALVKLMSAAGLVWQQMPYLGGRGWVSLADKTVQLIGPDRAQDLGVRGGVARQDHAPKPVSSLT